VKTFAHSLKMHEERLQDLAKKRADLHFQIEEKRLGLLELKHQQLQERKQIDPALAQEIERLRKRVAEYSARFVSQNTVEKDRKLVRIGKKTPGDDQVVRF